MKLKIGIIPKLTLVFVLFAAALLAGVGWQTYSRGQDIVQQAVTSELSAVAGEKQAELAAWANDRQVDIAALAAWPDVTANVAALIAATPGSADAQAAHDRLIPFLKLHTDVSHEYIALLVIDAAPVRSGDGRLLGVLAGQLNLAQFDAIVSRRTSLRQTDDTYVVNSQSLLVTQPRFISDPAVLQRGIHTAAVQDCLTHNSGVVLDQDYRGVPAIAVYRWLPEQESCLVVSLDQAEAFAPAGALGQAILVIAILALFAASLLAVVLAGTITRPILALQAGAARFGAGDLDVRLPETSGDELGRLAGEFNRMAIAVSEKEAKLREHADKLTQANHELEAFSYSVSHDLRAPLRAIDGFSRILLEDYAASLDAEAQRCLNVVRDNTQKMGLLIDDLLAFSRLSRQPLNLRLIAPADIVRQALASLRAEQDGRHVDIIIGALPDCRGDPAMLAQVFVNLLSNALKYSRRREIARIEIGFHAAGGENVYFVKDNGAGFDMQYARKLFGVFQRLHRADEFEGTGVGLAIVQSIISRHGGRIWAEAVVDQGATFFFTLPAVLPPEPAPVVVPLDTIAQRVSELV